MLEQAQHMVLRLTTIFMLVTFTTDFPLVNTLLPLPHLATCSSMSVVSAGYDTVIMT